MRTRQVLLPFVVFLSLLSAAARAQEQPWTSLFDGKTLHKDVGKNGDVKIVDGRVELKHGGNMDFSAFIDCWRDNCTRAWFDFTTEMMTEVKANGCVALVPIISGVGDMLYAVIVIDNSRDLDLTLSGVRKTGSITNGPSQFKSVAKDGEWFKLRVRMEDRHLQVWVNEKLVTDRNGTYAGGLSVTAHSRDAKIALRNMRVQRLPPKAEHKADTVEPDKIARQIAYLQQPSFKCFPLINYHIHLKGDLTLEKALAHSRASGVFYGIAANCGVKFPITNDQGIDDYVQKLEGQPCFIGMQAEGREWPTLFSKEAIAKFDYIFTDGMTIVDHRGKRARLWIPEEVDIPDKQAFMELLVRTIENILDNEPVDIYANPTYLPDVIAKEYDTLWTPERLKRVIDAAARNGVAIEISNRLKLPKADFIRQARQAGIKFTIGTNNVDSNLGREEYALQMIRECDLSCHDMFLPKPDGKKPIQVRGFKMKK
jgi:hypothetical protein